jgi:hypothetical protein
MGIALLPLITGCVATTTTTTDPNNTVVGELQVLLLKRMVQHGVIRFLSGNFSKIQEAEKVIISVSNRVAVSDTITVADLKNAAVDVIPWQQMHPQDQILLRDLLDVIAIVIQEQIGNDLLGEDIRVRVQTMLGWIHAAIQFSRGN